MALKAFLDSLDGLPEPLREHYVEAEDGQFRLDVAPVGGYALEDVAGLKRVAEDRKNRHGKLQAELDSLKERLGDLDIDAAREALERPSKPAKASQDEIKQHVEAARQEMAERHKAEREELEGRATRYRSQAEKLLIDSEVARLLTKDGLKGSFGLLRDPVRSRVKVVEEDGELGLQIMQADGAPMYAEKQTANGRTVDPAGLEDLLKALRDDPEFMRAFDGTGASGGGATGAGRSVVGNSNVDMSLPPEDRLAAAWGAGQ
jgi:hypothetical protein